MKTIPISYRLRSLAGAPLRAQVRAARARFLQLAKDNCCGAQRQMLQSLLQLNSESAFARDFGLSPGMTLQEFRQRVPVSDYELYRPYVDRVARGEHSALLGRDNELLMFAVTSGTTAASRLIPVTTRFLKDYRRAWQMWGVATYSEHAVLPKLNILQIASSHRRFRAPDGTPCGNISGLVVSMQSAIVRTLYTIPAAISGIENPDLKRSLILRLALADSMIGMMITANPSTLLQLMDQANQDAETIIRDIHDGGFRTIDPEFPLALLRHRSFRPNPERAQELSRIIESFGTLVPRECWPWMRILGVWSGGSAGAYVSRLRNLCGDLPIRDHGLHASEGRMTHPIEDNTSAGVLEIQTHYFEFIPLRDADSQSPEILEAHELTVGEEYLILLTTSSGFWRYNIRDVVRCVGFHGTTPMLEFRHKGAHISSITGEKLAESQVVEAMQSTCRRLDIQPDLFTLTPEWGDPPGYTLYLDLPEHRRISNSEQFASMVDQELAVRNEEYRDKRRSGRLRPVSVEVLPKADWKQFAFSRLQRSGGSCEQYKHPCLLPDPEFRNLFRADCRMTIEEHTRGH